MSDRCPAHCTRSPPRYGRGPTRTRSARSVVNAHYRVAYLYTRAEVVEGVAEVDLPAGNVFFSCRSGDFAFDIFRRRR